MSSFTLRKIRSTKAVVSVGNLGDEQESDAEWKTAEGHLVVRATNHLGDTHYWVRCLQRRWSSHDTLNDARKAIAWLRARRR